jgi:hypothetical protein
MGYSMIKIDLPMGILDQINKRKHFTQMTKTEKRGLFARLESIPKWGMAGHALDRVKQKGINATYYDIVSIIDYCDIIEYRIADLAHVLNPDQVCDERMIVRSKSIVNRSYDLSVVFSLTYEKIITVWMNDVDDQHKTINMSVFDPNMEVII